MFKMYRVHVYHIAVDDKPGGTAARLKALADAGVHLEYVHSERADGKPGAGELLVAPRQVKAEMDLVKKAGFHEIPEPIVMRFEGDDKTGLGGRVTMEWEKAGINLHGLMMAVVNGRFVGYAQFDHADDANKAAHLLAQLGSQE
jgi:formylmethanofuran:tetrahydromethanopterin formyltransferase